MTEWIEFCQKLPEGKTEETDIWKTVFTHYKHQAFTNELYVSRKERTYYRTKEEALWKMMKYTRDHKMDIGQWKYTCKEKTCIRSDDKDKPSLYVTVEVKKHIPRSIPISTIKDRTIDKYYSKSSDDDEEPVEIKYPEIVMPDYLLGPDSPTPENKPVKKKAKVEHNVE